MALKRKSSKKPRKLIYDVSGSEAFAAQLKVVRTAKGYTQEALAEEAGISLSQVARLETCANPTISTVFAIARALKISPSELFDFKLPPKKD